MWLAFENHNLNFFVEGSTPSPEGDLKQPHNRNGSALLILKSSQATVQVYM
jgi:hypothetical protein